MRAVVALVPGEASGKEARLLKLLFMQLMASPCCLPFCQCGRARCRKPLQKISCNLGNIWNALSVTWLCDWKEHFIWRFAIFWCYWHYTITFPVIYHIVEYRDKFASPYIYHITEKYRDRFSQLLYTKMMPVFSWEYSADFLFKNLSWTYSAPWGFPPNYFEIEIPSHPLDSTIVPSKRKSRGLSAFCSRCAEWTESVSAAKASLFPFPWQSGGNGAKMGAFSYML